MKNTKISIVVSGDICVNVHQWQTKHQGPQGLNWQHFPQLHQDIKGGTALLLAKLVALSTGAAIHSPELQAEDKNLPPEILRSTLELGLFPVQPQADQPDSVYRITRFLGFTGPAAGPPALLPITGDDVQARLVILDDNNDGFNAREEYWPLALKTPGTSPVVIYKTNNPASSSPIWQQIEKTHLQNTIVVIYGDDLRAKGVNISQGLSWEKTALEFVWQINNNPTLAYLANARHLIVPLGLEGAVYYRNDGLAAESRLFFMTNEFEGSFIKESQGKMYGLSSCFVAGLAHSIAAGILIQEDLTKSIEEGIREGIVAAQKYYNLGFGASLPETAFPDPCIFIESENDFIYKEQIQDVPIRNSNNPKCRACWYIIKDKSSSGLSEIAYDIVKNGEKSALKFIPIARFGNLITVDRTEIEGYRSIKNLILEYISAKNITRPLSIAVFGTPGSGKSFGVTEVAATIAPGLIQKLNFNLSQLQSLADLIAAFHKVRDLVLEGKLPLVFFDEFDSAFNGSLGWLKYFLAPMQDGVFREGDSLHPLGKAIFVFAGGTSSTFTEFCGETLQDEAEYKQFFRHFQSAKGPDFVSRLRGYVNILGPNQTDEQGDHLFVIRRAMLLRSLLERKTPHLLNEHRQAQIDDGVLRALLKAPRYKHESRSMEAILEMSRLSTAKKWEQSHLPPKEQLKLHVDEEQFARHLMHDAFFSEKIEQLAMNLHQKSGYLREENDNPAASCRCPWADLREEHKASARSLAKHIPNALRKINYDVVSVNEKPAPIEFSAKELRILAEYDHKRWSLEKKEAGWKHGRLYNEQKKLHPLLIPWDILTAEVQTKIMENIKHWPEILADASFTIERLKSLCYCETQI
ncbi:RyR domain-containing protein [Sporomusa termitida]|uniref:RyR domain protein n=1 Tax=Sporomusa termitida TaxID=2377 RepID=A0A517DWC8_9FIRM|nr:RyR domain-containing protein [Sporomusa termitida]QDR81647.1 RyR domain protein [Sporomusa termitida]